MPTLDLIQSDAFDLFQKQSWPDAKVETWRYISVDPSRLDQAHRGHPPTGSEDLSGLPESAGRMVLVDGHVREVVLATEHVARGVFAGPISRAPAELRRLAGTHIDRAVPASSHRFVSWNLLGSPEPIVVHLPAAGAGEEAAELPPLVVVHAMARTGSPMPRLVVLADDGARGSLIEHFLTLDPELSGTFPVAVTEVFVGRSAELHHGTVHDLPRAIPCVHTVGARVGASGRYVHAGALLGAGSSRQERIVHLEAADSSSDVRVMVLGRGRAHHDLYTSARHTAPRTVSRLQVRAALLQRSRASVIGHLWIDEAGDQADGAQEARGLLLSGKARMDAIPQLEIVHDVVKASHGVGISQLEEEDIFYARARGFTRREAENLLTMGFFQPIVDAIPSVSLREGIQAALSAALDAR